MTFLSNIDFTADAPAQGQTAGLWTSASSPRYRTMRCGSGPTGRERADVEPPWPAHGLFTRFGAEAYARQGLGALRARRRMLRHQRTASPPPGNTVTIGRSTTARRLRDFPVGRDSSAAVGASRCEAPTVCPRSSPVVVSACGRFCARGASRSRRP